MKPRYRYELMIYWSEDDQSFIADVPELAGCMADGLTYAAALSNVERVMEEWIEVAHELNREIPAPKVRQLFP